MSSQLRCLSAASAMRESLSGIVVIQADGSEDTGAQPPAKRPRSAAPKPWSTAEGPRGLREAAAAGGNGIEGLRSLSAGANARSAVSDLETLTRTLSHRRRSGQAALEGGHNASAQAVSPLAKVRLQQDAEKAHRRGNESATDMLCASAIMWS